MSLTCSTCQLFARLPPLTLEYMLVLGVSVRHYIQRDASASVELLKVLSIDVFVDFFKAVSWTWGANKHAKFEQRSG